MSENINLKQPASEKKHNIENLYKKSPPSILIGISTFELHTQAAQQIALGSNHHPKDNHRTQNKLNKPKKSALSGSTGLFKFAARITRLFQALVLDDPFAELYLAKTYRCLMQAKSGIVSYIEQYNNKLASIKGMTINPYYSTHPRIFTLKSRNPYTGLAAQVICLYDDLVRIIYAGQDRIVFDRVETSTVLRKIRDRIRLAFNIAFQWQHTTVTRYDVRHCTPIAKTAYQKMLVNLSSEILTGTFQAPLTPSRRQTSLN